MVRPRDESARARFASELDRNFSVVASAGSGKTTAITKRILSIAHSPNAVKILPQSGHRHLHQSCGGRNATAHAASSTPGKFATRRADCIQSRLLRHNPFLLHETPD